VLAYIVAAALLFLFDRPMDRLRVWLTEPRKWTVQAA
jgi:hypothetical protein